VATTGGKKASLTTSWKAWRVLGEEQDPIGTDTATRRGRWTMYSAPAERAPRRWKAVQRRASDPSVDCKMGVHSLGFSRQGVQLDNLDACSF
jgi:hypothetical protein